MDKLSLGKTSALFVEVSDKIYSLFPQEQVFNKHKKIWIGKAAGCLDKQCSSDLCSSSSDEYEFSNTALERRTNFILSDDLRLDISPNL